MNDDEYVVEKAEEFSGFEEVPIGMRAELSACDARLECGDVSENQVVTDQGMIVFNGWTSFDPAHPIANEFLTSLATAFDGVLEDNVNVVWWTPDIS